MGEYPYNCWNMPASEASPSVGGIGVGVGDGYSCNWRCNNKAREGKDSRLRLQCVKGKEGAILGKTTSFQCLTHQNDVILRKFTNHSVHENPADSANSPI
ncbi:hypothetical protein PVL29_025437 [Vitis rotundifolia]|uniref:Uncharacterized protein n=1 Tax=Vitis rotundifolia TaxID=103349 RepID=A0AA38YJT4_VITRO|nr:hypothetical protein PVL29_025437 [Vitis rotundifolia]